MDKTGLNPCYLLNKFGMELKIEIHEITSHDIAKMLSCDVRSAQRRLSLLRDAYGLKKHSIVTFDLFCEYYQIRPQDIHITHEK